MGVSFSSFIHEDLRESFHRMSFLDKIGFLFVHGVDRLNLWHRLPVFLGLVYLQTRRTLLDNYNLLDVGRITGSSFDPHQYLYRTDDGRFNDPNNSIAGSQGTFIGRNMLPSTPQDELQLLDPNPTVVATELLARRNFRGTGKQFNMIAASWIQFMIHDWIDHLEDTQQVKLDSNFTTDSNQCPLTTFNFYKTKQINTGQEDIDVGHYNIRTAWWDGSAIYGKNTQTATSVRSFRDGKLLIGNDNLLKRNNEGVPVSGDVRNSWAGVSILQALFVKEHNAVCDALHDEYPELDDEELYRHARLVTSAVIAKIHTIDWTVELLKTDTMRASMMANWYGVLGKRVKETFGSIGGSTVGPVLSGLVGLKQPNNHGVPYSLTEEFVGVYRMHSLLPDSLQLRNINAQPAGPNKSPQLLRDVGMEELIGLKGEDSLSKIGFQRTLVSMGHQSCGALELWNYPAFLRDLIVQNEDGTERSDHVDLASLEVYRDRERRLCRYNQFRRNVLMIPISNWQDLSDDGETIEILKKVYGNDVEKLDLLVGLMAEKKIKGFAISETAFFIFIVMASRRLQADRFFTSDFNSRTYTKKGFDWVNTTESLKQVIDRHFPDISDKWINSTSAFSVWDAPPNPSNIVPLYLRIPPM